MAEFVNLNVEDMIPEFELVKKLRMFGEHELNNVIRKRKQFEYKMQRGTKSKEDILNYIKYEWDLLTIIKKKSVEKEFNSMKHNISFSIANHINKLFNVAIRRFPSDLKIWLNYIKFCKRVQFYSYVSRVLDQLLEVHSDKPALFKLAAQTEYEHLNCIEKARKYLLNGIHLHKDSQLLYEEAFKLELNYADSKRKEFIEKKEPIPADPILEGRSAQVIYESAVKTIHSVELNARFLKLAEQYSFTESLRKKILADLVENFETEELTWRILATQELKEPSKSPRDRIKLCTSIYDKAVAKLNTVSMWSIYIDAMRDLNRDLKTLPVLKKNCLLKAYYGAYTAGKLTEKYYLLLCDFLRGENKADLLDSVLKYGTEKIPGSVALWEARIKFELSKNKGEEACKILHEAVTAINKTEQPHSTMPLWKIVLEYYQINNSVRAEELFKAAIASKPEQVAKAFKPMYLEWTALSKGINAARKTYASLATSLPWSLNLHNKMIELEDLQPTVSVKNMRNCHQLSVQQFGESSTSVWMSFIKFERTHGDPTKIPDLHSRALVRLNKSLVDVFTSEFSMSQAEAMTEDMVPCDGLRK